MSPRTMSRSAAERGFALLVVLWTMALLAFVATQITALGRGATQLSSNLRRAAAVEAAADGALHEAVLHLLDASDARWRADGTAHEIRRRAIVSTVRATDEAGKVNPNVAPPETLQALLRASGVDAQAAAEIAAAITLWRAPDPKLEPGNPPVARYRSAGRAFGPPGEPFQTLDEIGLVLGMTPAILARVAPHLSLYNPGALSPRAADPFVRQAIRDTLGSAPAEPDEAPRVVSIRVESTDGAARFARRAVVQLQAGAAGLPYAILAWDAPVPDGA